MHIKSIHKIFIKDKPTHYKINKIIKKDKTYTCYARKHTKKFKLCKQININ